MLGEALPLLLLILAGLCLLRSNGESLLLIGDSVDRFILVEWCEVSHGEEIEVSRLKKASNMWAITSPHIKNWVSDTITFRDDPYFHCSEGQDTITNVHMLGSAAQGPYFKDDKNLKGFEYRDSGKRITKSLELYVSAYSIPDKIVLTTVLWDALGALERHEGRSELFIPGSELFNHTIDTFRSNLIQRYDQICSHFKHKHGYPDHKRAPVVALRTGVWCQAGGDILHHMNHVVRSLCKDRHIPLYDFDR